MRGLTALCALSLSVLVCCLCGSNPGSVHAQQQTHLLKEKLEVGTVRIVVGQRAMDIALTHFPGTNYASTTNSAVAKSFRCEEWVTAMDAGRASEVCRSYREINITNTSWVGEQKFDVPGTDWKNNQTFGMKVRADGTREISHETYEYISAEERKFVQLDTDADLLPGRDAKVGESWKVAKEKLGRIALATHVDKIDSADVTVKFDSTQAADNGDTLAVMTVSGTVAASCKIDSGIGDQPETELRSDIKLEGGAWFNITRGQMVRYEWKGSATAAGRLNGSDASASTTFTEINDYGYATLLEKAVENGSEGPESATEIQTFKHTAVDPAHVVIGRNNGKVTRLQVFDPATKKVVKTVLAMPATNTVNTLALSPDRKQIAFSSNLNAGISLADADCFVLELETGQINQVSPSWADNNGMAQPLDTGKTTSISGRIVWYDDDKRNPRDRSDGFTGIARIDHTPCAVVVGADGNFTLTGVPVGTSVVLQIHGRLPLYSDGKSRDAYTAYAGMTTVAMTLESSAKDLGDVRLNAGHAETRYDRPCWQGESLWVNLSAWTRSYKVGYPKHTWEMVDFGELQLLFGGFSVSRDGKLAAFCREGTGSGVTMCDTKGKALWNADVPGVVVSYKGESAWTADGNWVCTAGIENTQGKNLWGSPALIAADPANKQAALVRAWPQLAGHTMMSLALDQSPTLGFFVTHKYVADKNATYGDAWAWNVGTDTLTRLTTLGDVICVASYGR